MVDVIEIFDGVQNIEFKKLTYCAEVQAELPIFKLKESSVKEWNRKAMIQNTKMFVEINGKQPVNEQEVRNWLDSHREVHILAG